MKISLDSLLAVLKQSGLIPPERVEALLSDCPAGSGDRPDAKTFVEFLMKKGEITRWQGEKLLQGKHKGFFLGKYRLLSLLGKGGMSSVYLAEHVVMKRRTAIKVLPHKRVNDASYLGRFHREAQAVAMLDHPNIVRAYDVDHIVDGSMEIHYLVMEYVAGKSLQEIVAKFGPLHPVDAADYIHQAARGLEHAHRANIVHRDIKPGNLLVDKTGTVKLLDLGLAQLFNGTEGESLTLQHDEKVLGTADFLSPEQAKDSHRVDRRADIYSLGCTLYYLLTGRPPFDEGSLAQRLLAHQQQEPPAVTETRQDVPESLLVILRKMMEKEPENRYQRAVEAADALDDWLHEHGGQRWITRLENRARHAGESANRIRTRREPPQDPHSGTPPGGGTPEPELGAFIATLEAGSTSSVFDSRRGSGIDTSRSGKSKSGSGSALQDTAPNSAVKSNVNTAIDGPAGQESLSSVIQPSTISTRMSAIRRAKQRRHRLYAIAGGVLLVIAIALLVWALAFSP